MACTAAATGSPGPRRAKSTAAASKPTKPSRQVDVDTDTTHGGGHEGSFRLSQARGVFVTQVHAYDSAP